MLANSMQFSMSERTQDSTSAIRKTRDHDKLNTIIEKNGGAEEEEFEEEEKAASNEFEIEEFPSSIRDEPEVDSEQQAREKERMRLKKNKLVSKVMENSFRPSLANSMKQIQPECPVC